MSRYQPYVKLHVTLLATSRSTPNPLFFNLPADTILPTTILTTGATARAIAHHPSPGFQSISWHGETFPGSNEFVVKVFSKTLLSDQVIMEILGEEPSWLLRKEWYSYPVLKPVSSYAPVEPVKGVQYLAGMETWIST
jgi:prenylcysteine oxidase/farnesylcysteine lyase